jgi:hypothetical protein
MEAPRLDPEAQAAENLGALAVPQADIAELDHRQRTAPNQDGAS